MKISTLLKIVTLFFFIIFSATFIIFAFRSLPLEFVNHSQTFVPDNLKDSQMAASLLAVSPVLTFTRNLQIKDINEDVRRLQIFLNKDPDTKIALSGPGSPGNETYKFGLATYAAVKKFQEKYRSEILTPGGLKAATGFVGSLTRAKINTLSSATTVSTPVIALKQPITNPLCGNNVLDSGEVCEVGPDGKFLTADDNIGGKTCQSFGYTRGTVFCGLDCKNFDIGLCVYNEKDLQNQPNLLVVQNQNQNQQQNLVSGSASSKTWAYSWAGNSYSNIVPLVFLDSSGLQNPARVKAMTDSKPDGHRAIILSHIEDPIASDSRDECANTYVNSSGVTVNTKLRCAWWDNGVATVKAELDNFFSQYSAIGGKVDYLVSDYEKGFSNWYLSDSNTFPASTYQETPYHAIETSPRYSEISSRLAALGFSSSSLKNIWQWVGEDYLIWNEVALERQANYLNSAIYEPLKKYFPQAFYNAYEYYNHANSYSVPDFNGNLDFKYGNGAHAGTHQAPSMYGQLGNLSAYRADLLGLSSFPISPFNGMLHSLNRLRAMKLSSSAPITPWLPYKSLSSSAFANSDYYQEFVLHVLLTGVDNVILWNPHPPQNDTADSQFNDILKEFDSLTGFSGRQTLVSGLAPWNSGYILSGMSAGGKKIWRFTPDAGGATISAQSSSVVVKTGVSTVTFPDASIYVPASPVSNIGYWIVQNGTAANPTIAQNQKENFWRALADSIIKIPDKLYSAVIYSTLGLPH